jgi:GMP synthase (glutamine-hydrolysing)
MRTGEADQVVSLFREHYNIPLVAADEEERFLSALAGEAIPKPSARPSASSSSTSSKKRRRASAAPTSSPRARSIPDVIESVSFDPAVRR